jgi:hypothetical protein
MTEVIVLPGASPAEGIAAGRGATFYAGDLLRGDSSAATLCAAPPSCSSRCPRVSMTWPPNDGAWFTESRQALLYFAPVSRAGHF